MPLSEWWPCQQSMSLLTLRHSPCPAQVPPGCSPGSWGDFPVPSAQWRTYLLSPLPLPSQCCQCPAAGAIARQPTQPKPTTLSGHMVTGFPDTTLQIFPFHIVNLAATIQVTTGTQDTRTYEQEHQTSISYISKILIGAGHISPACIHQTGEHTHVLLITISRKKEDSAVCLQFPGKTKLQKTSSLKYFTWTATKAFSPLPVSSSFTSHIFETRPCTEHLSSQQPSPEILGQALYFQQGTL